MHHGVLTDAPTLTLWYSNESDIAFFTCQRITYLSFPGRARCQLQLCVFSWTDLVMSSRCSLVISTFVFDVLQISSECCYICRRCIALTCNTPSPRGSRPVYTSLRRNLEISILFKSCHRINNKRFSLRFLLFSFWHYSSR
jgi:hypothetical protein